jgi:Fe-S cluster biogenesis protein NfuA
VSKGATHIDAVIVHADDVAAAAITVLSQLPKAELAAIHRARLTEWVREVDARNGGTGTNAEIGEYFGKDGSTVSRLKAINEGLPDELLEAEGITDEDLTDVPACTLRQLADLDTNDKTQAMRQLRALKDNGGNSMAFAKQLATAMPGKRRRGRPAKPFTLTNRADGRFSLSVRHRPLGEENARELLEALKPFLLRITQEAEVESLDHHFGLTQVTVDGGCAGCTTHLITLAMNRLRSYVATKYRAFQDAFLALGAGPRPRIDRSPPDGGC